MMLGVQRTGVSEAAGALQRAGLIRYRRGVVTILDRRGLRQRACECYGVAKRGFDRLLGDPPSSQGPLSQDQAWQGTIRPCLTPPCCRSDATTRCAASGRARGASGTGRRRGSPGA